MPLSRHFYSLDEVQASYLYCLTNSRVEESLFWCKELLDSGCIGEAISILFEAWLWHIGPNCIRWILHSYPLLSSDELSETDILQATYRLASIPYKKHDNSLWNVMVSISEQLKDNLIPDRIVRKIPDKWHSTTNTETYFIASIYQGKACSAWWISQYMSNQTVWELLHWFCENVYIDYRQEYSEYLTILKNYSNLLGYENKEYDRIIRCIAILGFCFTKDDNKKESFDMKWIKEIDPKLQQSIQLWDNDIGKKERRLFKVHTSCLYGRTLRGSLTWSQNTLQQLNNVEKYFLGCPFWEEAISEYGKMNEEESIIIWNSDEEMEEFYEKYFPDDIPDEWTKDEKSKSHGDGVLGPIDIVNIWKYSRNYLSGKCRFAWDSTRSVSKILEKYKTIKSDCILHEMIEKLYNSNHVSNTSCSNDFLDRLDIDLEKLKPVHKVLRIKKN